MFTVGDAVVYGTQGVCRISEITEMTVAKVVRSYYVLVPVYSEKTTLYVPVDNEEVVKSRMRPVFRFYGSGRRAEVLCSDHRSA